MQTNIGLFLAKRALLEPEKTGLIFQGEEISYREWNERVNRAAHGFASLGIQAGDRVGLLVTNTPEFLDCLFGLAKIGAIVVPLNWRAAPPEIAFAAEDAGVRLFIYDAEFAEVADSIKDQLSAEFYLIIGGETGGTLQSYSDLLSDQPATEPVLAGGEDDACLIMYTSGTTGHPKGAVMTHKNLFFEVCTVIHSGDWRSGDKVLVALPLFHIGGLIYVINTVYVGCTSVLMKAFDPTAFLQLIEAHKVDAFLAVPAMLNFIMQVPAYKETDLSSVRVAMAGAAPVPVPLLKAWAERGVDILQVYGLTEVSGGAAVLTTDRAMDKVGSTGLPMFHTDIRVMGEEGNDAAPEEVGEILIRGPHVMKEYWNDPQATAEAIVDGWLLTGDLGKFDEEGYLYIVERKKDMIISGGENIYPAEIESVLAEMNQIAEAAVIGVPDSEWGESVCVVARLKDGESLTLNDLTGFCSLKLGKFKLPKKLIVTDEPLPRTAAGKVLKRVLREGIAA